MQERYPGGWCVARSEIGRCPCFRSPPRRRVPRPSRPRAPAARHAGQWAALPAAVRGHGALVFDLFATWRMDSGVYEEMVRGGRGWCVWQAGGATRLLLIPRAAPAGHIRRRCVGAAVGGHARSGAPTAAALHAQQSRCGALLVGGEGRLAPSTYIAAFRLLLHCALLGSAELAGAPCKLTWSGALPLGPCRVLGGDGWPGAPAAPHPPRRLCLWHAGRWLPAFRTARLCSPRCQRRRRRWRQSALNIGEGRGEAVLNRDEGRPEPAARPRLRH